jgi:hypothetical protein
MAHAGYLSRSGLGAEPPPEPVEEDEPAPPETLPEPIPSVPSVPASPAGLASPAEPVVTATPEPTPSPV